MPESTISKYFTPDIEDIRVGYECEVLPINEEMGWKSGRLSFERGHQSSDPKSLYNLSPFWYTLRKDDGNYGPTRIQIPNLQHIRVPYLTKEQIEKEGWKLDYSRHVTPGTAYYKRDYNLWVIDTYCKIQDGDNTLFKGECKDINTFRYICKLLNIK